MSIKTIRQVIFFLLIAFPASLGACNSSLQPTDKQADASPPAEEARETQTSAPPTATELPTDTPTLAPPTETPLPTAIPKTSTPTLSGPPAGTDITQELPLGDASKGEALANTMGCIACHNPLPGGENIGPNWMPANNRIYDEDNPGIGVRAEHRYQEPGYTGKATNATQYLFESIVMSDAFIVRGTPTYTRMANNYGQLLTLQDVADLIAYLLTIK